MDMTTLKPQRIVIKVGTKALSDEHDELDKAVIASIVSQIACLKRAGHEVVLVSSGAVGAGKAVFHIFGDGVPEKQVYAAIGQARLVGMYSAILEREKMLCAQLLVTRQDFVSIEHRHNIEVCLEHLLHDDVLPIVNENDVVAVEELLLTESDERGAFTDNDELAGFVAETIGAGVVIFVTSVDGILDEDGTVLPLLQLDRDSVAHSAISEEESPSGKGGMSAKFSVAKRLVTQGRRVHIINVHAEETFQEIVDKGTSSSGTTLHAPPR